MAEQPQDTTPAPDLVAELTQLLIAAVADINDGQLPDAETKLQATNLQLPALVTHPLAYLVRARAIYVQGRIYQKRQLLAQALAEYRSAADYVGESSAGDSLLPDVLFRIALVYFSMEKLRTAREYYRQAYHIANRAQNYAVAALALESLGTIATSMDEPSEAMDYYQATRLESSRSAKPARIAGAYQALAWLQGQYGPYEEAFINAATAEALAATETNIAQRMNGLTEVAEVFLRGHELQRAEVVLRQAESLTERAADPERQASLYLVMAQLFKAKRDWEKWQYYAHEAYRLAEEPLYKMEHGVELLRCLTFVGDSAAAHQLLLDLQAYAATSAEEDKETTERYLALSSEAAAVHAAASQDYVAADEHFSKATSRVGRLRRYKRASLYREYALTLRQWAQQSHNPNLLRRALDQLRHSNKTFHSMALRVEEEVGNQLLAAWQSEVV